MRLKVAKMSQPSLLEIIPEQLFQTHSISDIDQVQKKLQYEIERKREELRAMVGYVSRLQKLDSPPSSK